jgi:hypothetical protein
MRQQNKLFTFMYITCDNYAHLVTFKSYSLIDESNTSQSQKKQKWNWSKENKIFFAFLVFHRRRCSYGLVCDFYVACRCI